MICIATGMNKTPFRKVSGPNGKVRRRYVTEPRMIMTCARDFRGDRARTNRLPQETAINPSDWSRQEFGAPAGNSLQAMRAAAAALKARDISNTDNGIGRLVITESRSGGGDDPGNPRTIPA
jgi:hypothetical protein